MSSPAIERSAVLVAHRQATRRTALAQSIVLHIIVIALGLVFAFPLYWMIITSLKSVQELDLIPPSLFPMNPQPQNYPEALLNPNRYFPLFFWNTVVYTVLAIAGNLISNTLVGYGFARIPFRGRNFLFILVLSTLMVPSQVLLIPQYLLFKQFGWLDSILPLVIPAYFGSAFYIFLLRQFFLTIPRELEEAAVLDGCSRFGVYWRIVLPLSGSALAALAIFTFLANWNDFFGPFVFTNDLMMRTLPVGLTIFNGEYWSERGLIMAGATISTIPVLVVYALFQQHIIRGVTLTGLKG